MTLGMHVKLDMDKAFEDAVRSVVERRVVLYPVGGKTTVRDCPGTVWGPFLRPFRNHLGPFGNWFGMVSDFPVHRHREISARQQPARRICVRSHAERNLRGEARDIGVSLHAAKT